MSVTECFHTYYALVEESEHLAPDFLAPRLFVVQDSVRGG